MNIPRRTERKIEVTVIAFGLFAVLVGLLSFVVLLVGRQ